MANQVIHENGQENMKFSKIPNAILFVKRSELGDDNNCHRTPCIISHKWFMALYLKSQAREILLKVFALSPRAPYPKEFKDKGVTHLPSLLLKQSDESGFDEQLLSDSKEIEAAILRLPGYVLTSDKEAEKAIANLYIKFSGLLRSDAHTQVTKERALLLELLRIDEFLGENGGFKFLCSDHLTLADCDLLPKLQHIRIAGRAGYSTKAFSDSCPFDQDIVLHYENKVLVKSATLDRPTLQKLYFTFSLPENILHGA